MLGPTHRPVSTARLRAAASAPWAAPAPRQPAHQLISCPPPRPSSPLPPPYQPVDVELLQACEGQTGLAESGPQQRLKAARCQVQPPQAAKRLKHPGLQGQPRPVACPDVQLLEGGAKGARRGEAQSRDSSPAPETWGGKRNRTKDARWGAMRRENATGRWGAKTAVLLKGRVFFQGKNDVDVKRAGTSARMGFGDGSDGGLDRAPRSGPGERCEVVRARRFGWPCFKLPVPRPKVGTTGLPWSFPRPTPQHSCSMPATAAAWGASASEQRRRRKRRWRRQWRAGRRRRATQPSSPAVCARAEASEAAAHALTG